MKNNHVNNYLLGIMGIFLGIVLTCAVVIPQAVQINNWTNGNIWGNAAKYWESLGYHVVADALGNLLPLSGDNLSDLGSEAASWRDAWIDGTIYQNTFAVPQAPGTPDYVVGVNTATDDVPGSTGYWVKSGSTGRVVRSTTDANADDDIQWAVTNGYLVQMTPGAFEIINTINITAKFGGALVGSSRASGINNDYTQAKLGTALTVDTGLTGAVILVDNTTAMYTLSTFRIEIDSTKQVSGDGILNNSQGLCIEHLWIEGAKENGFHNSDTGASNPSVQVYDLTISNSGDCGIYWAGGSDSVFDKIDSFSNGEYGLKISAGGVLSFHHFNFYSNTLGGVQIDTDISTNRYGFTFRDGSINSNGQNGFIITGDPTTAEYMSQFVIDTVRFFDNSASSDSTYNDIIVNNRIAQFSIINSKFFKGASANNTGWGIAFPINCLGISVMYNDYGTGACDYGFLTTLSPVAMRANTGYVTENSGTATMLINTGAIVVNHGLATTPTRVQVTMTSDPGLAVSTYVDTYTATQFTIHTSANVTSATTFDWRAVVGEGN